MTNQKFDTFQLPNGLRVVVQHMPGVQSAAMTLMVPAGGVHDPAGASGTAAILSEMFPRGAGKLTARELASAMDNLGLQRSVSVGVSHITFSTATTADRIVEAVPLIAQMLREPRLNQEQFGPARDLVLQSLHAMEDEPEQRLGRYLRRCSYPDPWGNPARGILDQVESISLAAVQEHFRRHVVPDGAVLGIAGNIQASQIQPAIEESFATWNAVDDSVISPTQAQSSPCHVEHDSAQTHIGLSWSTVPYSNDRYYEAWAAIGILSGGMSSRLFTEVREKRGLCYSVSASINTLKDEARVFGYAGTTNERAQETLDVMIAEIRRLHEGITEEELHRCKARAKSSLIMQQESTTSRANSLARDTLHLGRCRSLLEIRSLIDNLTVPQVTRFAEEFAPTSIVLVTIGPEALDPASALTSAVAV